MTAAAKKLIQNIRKKITSTKDGRPATRAEVAAAVGVSDTSIENWEFGRCAVAESSMEKLEEAIAKLAKLQTGLPSGISAHSRNGASGLKKALGGLASGKAVCAPAPIIGEKPPGYPIPGKIKNLKAEEAKLAKFINKIGIKLYGNPAGVPCNDGGVWWQFTAEFPPKAMERIIKQFNEHNRQVGHKKSAQYAADMKSNNWGWTGEPVLFSRDGDLLNGQNRMNAGRACGRPVVFSVGVGLHPTAIRYMDRQHVRNNTHQGQAEGLHYNHVRTPTLGLLHRFERSDDAKDYLEENGAGVRVGGPRHAALNEHYKDELDPALKFIHGLRWGIGRNALPKHLATFMFMLMARQSVDAAHYFMLSLADATHALPGSPIYALRNKLMKFVGDRRSSPARHKALVAEQIGKGGTDALVARGTEAIIMRTIAFAWNSFCSHKKNASGNFRSAPEGTTTTMILKAMAAPGPKALDEAKAFTPEALKAVLERAEACRAKEERVAHNKNRDEGDVKLSAIKRALETN